MKKFLCSFCNSERLIPILDFGDMALAGGFLSTDLVGREPKYSMTFSFCNQCKAVQIPQKINPDEMFQDYFYFSSSISTLAKHFETHAENITHNFISDKSTASVLEFGCNDGVLLRPLVKQGINQVIGVDPAKNVVEANPVPGSHQIIGYFNEEMSHEILQNFGSQDVIFANNCYAHITDINSVTKAVKNLLKEEGVFVFEVHHLLKLIDEMQFDMIYHEHIYYYSVIFLVEYFERFALRLFKVEEINIHAGSIRVYVCHKDSKHLNDEQSISSVIKREQASGLDSAEKLSSFAHKVNSFKTDLLKTLEDLKGKEKTIIGYGASGRANTILQFCSLDSSILEVIVDDAPAKQGFYTPGSHIKIVDNSYIKNNKPDYILVFAWAFIDEIAKKNQQFLDNGGKFIIPFPSITVLGQGDF